MVVLLEYILILLGIINLARSVKEEGEGFPRRRLFGQDVFRFAAFGGANVWGLGDHLPNRFSAFPYLLSQTVDNYGSVSTGSNYNAVCLESLIGDEKVYDIILLDFCHVVEPNVLHLAKRLRDRFPKALIIFVKYWRPLHIQRTSPTNEFNTINLLSWMDTNSLTDWTADEFKEAIVGDNGIWTDQRDTDGMGDLYYDYAAQVEGDVVELESITGRVQGVLSTNGGYFARSTLMSADGHAEMAAKINALIDSKNITTDDADDVGDFGEGDMCHVWFTTGNIGNIVHTGSAIHEYDTHYGKFALEFAEEGTVQIENPFDNERQLYLSFLVSTISGTYPDVEIIGFNLDVTISPIGTEVREADYVKTVAIGKLQSGTNVLTIRPSFTSSDQIPFRLVGISFTNGDVTPDMYSFAPMFR